MERVLQSLYFRAGFKNFFVILYYTGDSPGCKVYYTVLWSSSWFSGERRKIKIKKESHEGNGRNERAGNEILR